MFKLVFIICKHSIAYMGVKWAFNSVMSIKFVTMYHQSSRFDANLIRA